MMSYIEWKKYLKKNKGVYLYYFNIKEYRDQANSQEATKKEEGTKLSKYLIEHDKIYEVRLFLGKKTDTLDSEGKIIDEKSIDKSLLTIENVR